MKYTKSALGLLNAQYRSVLKKCLLINLGLFAMVAVTATPAMAETYYVATAQDGSTDTGITIGTMAAEDKTNYLSTSDAASTYLSTSTAASTYQTKIDSGHKLASNLVDGLGTMAAEDKTNYLSTSDAASTYLSTSAAASTYLSTSDAASTYLSTSTAASTYQTKIDSGHKLASNLVDGLGTAAAANTTTSVTSGSSDLVTSGGVYTALQDYATTSTTYTKTEVDSALAGKQGKLTSTSGNAGAGISISDAGVISVKDDSISNSMLTANAVKNGNIMDGEITKSKLATAVQTSLDKADSALQASNITTGTTNGTIKVGSTEIAIKGLDTAAYAKTTDFASAAQGAKADTALQNFSTMTATDVNTALGYTAANAANVYTKAEVDAVTKFTADGKNYADGDTALQAIAKLDTVIGDANSGLTKGVADNAAAITALTDGSGALNVATATVSGAATVGSLAISGASGKGIDASGNATFTSLDTGNGKIKTTGSLEGGNLSVTGTSVLKGTVTVENGGAAKITLGNDGTINAVGKATVDSLVATNGIQAGASNAFTVSNAGAITNVAGITSQGNISAANNTILGKSLNATTSFELAGTTVTSIDTAGLAASETGSTQALATTSSVAATITAQAQGATFTPATGSDITATTIGGAINEVAADYKAADANITNGTTNFTGFKLGGSSVSGIASNAITSTTASTSILATTDAVYDTVKAEAENGTYTGTKVTGSTATTVKGALSDAATQINTNTKTIGATSIGAGTAGSLTGKTIGDGTSSTVTVTSALETLNATNVSQNSTLNALAYLVDGGSVDAATGARTVGTTIAATKADGTGTAGNLVEAVNAASTINQNQITATGVLNVDGTYKAAGLTDPMYKNNGTAGTSLAGSLNILASNITKVTGGSVNTSTGAVENDYMTGVTGVSYTALANDSTTPLASAIGQINKNIGVAASAAKGNISATATVNANLDSLDTAIGNRANFGSTSITGVNTTANSDVVTAVNAVDTALVNTQTALGGMINKTGDVYVNTALTDTTTPNGFVASTTTATLTDQLKNYAGNVNTALGGAFDNTGAWSTTVDNDNGSASYAYSATSNVMAAMNQVASSIGVADDLKATDKTGASIDGVNGLTKANTVNQNLTALNNTVGDITGLSAGTGSTGNAITNGTGNAATTVVEALNNIDATLGQIHGLKMGNSHLKANSNLAAGTTVEDHLVSLDDAIGNRNYSSTRYVTAGSDLSTAVGTLDQNLNRVEHKVNNLRHDFEAGMASMAAMTALVPNPRASGDTSLSIGTGAYEGHTAMAIGGFHYITDNIMLNAGAAWGNTNDVAYRLGVTWSW